MLFLGTIFRNICSNSPYGAEIPSLVSMTTGWGMQNVTVHFQLATWTYEKTKTFIEIMNSFTWVGSWIKSKKHKKVCDKKKNWFWKL